MGRCSRDTAESDRHFLAPMHRRRPWNAGALLGVVGVSGPCSRDTAESADGPAVRGDGEFLAPTRRRRPSSSAGSSLCADGEFLAHRRGVPQDRPQAVRNPVRGDGEFLAPTCSSLRRLCSLRSHSSLVLQMWELQNLAGRRLVLQKMWELQQTVLDGVQTAQEALDGLTRKEATNGSGRSATGTRAS